ncbi:MAG TPA: hypothetical protein VMA77_34455 [Solirubrobacteraceae bacterium]|nr:hypothetical protein [Solirubrobacteraceae bacterium]
MAERAYTDAELEAAIAAIADPQRLREAQDLVTRSAPALARVLATALEEGGWFDMGHNQAVREATGHDDYGERVRAVRTMLAEETRLGMLVGVAVGFELARELERPRRRRQASPSNPMSSEAPGPSTSPGAPGSQTTEED